MSDVHLPSVRDWGHPALDVYADAGLLQRDADLADVISHARGRLAYLATPYSKVALCDCDAWHQGISLEAAVRAARWAKVLAAEGVTAVSPIIQSVEMVHADLADMLDPLDAVFWEGWCRPLLAASGVVIVPPIPGWKDSEGIWVEVCAALRSNRRVFLISEGTIRLGVPDGFR